MIIFDAHTTGTQNEQDEHFLTTTIFFQAYYDWAVLDLGNVTNTDSNPADAHDSMFQVTW